MIDRFSKRHAFLSNFHPSLIVWRRHEYPTVEHAYQAAKCANPAEAEAIRLAPTAAIAKASGRTALLRVDWEQVKVGVMRDLLARKFAVGSALSLLLVDTDAEELVEGNTWGDRYWGRVSGVGENWLGRLLMERRDWLKAAGE